MPSAQLILIVPEAHDEVAELLCEHAGEGGDMDGLDGEEAVAAFLADRIGTAVEAEFDSDQPSDPIHDIAAALDRVGGRYWGTYDAFAERSRGIRVVGRAILNRTGRPEDRQELEVPWKHGTPRLDVETLVAAGMAKSEAEATFADLVEGAPRNGAPAP